MLVALTVMCGIACLALVAAEVGKHALGRILAKVMASLAFVMLGLEALNVTGPYDTFALWILVGLVLGAIGDVALLGRSNAAFLAGLVAFLGGHVAYVVAAAQLVAPATWPAAGGVWIAVPVIAGGAALFLWLWPHLRGDHAAMRAPVIVYVAAIVTMVVAAIAVARSGVLSAPHHATFAIGAALFFVSDLAVARDKFVAKSVVNRIWGLPTYYAGQLLIAWTLVGL